MRKNMNGISAKPSYHLYDWDKNLSNLPDSTLFPERINLTMEWINKHFENT